MSFADHSSSPKGLAGERRVVTFLFCDVKGSTAFAERLDPEEWAEIMNMAFSYLIAPVERYGGTVARLMGDAILAFFGAPVAHEDDAQRAVLAGLDILQDLQPFRQELQREYQMDFDVRLGINTGPVVVGEIGTALAGEYTAMGDAVNLAARLEQIAQPGTLQISADTYRLVSAYFEVEELGGVEVRGKSGPVPVYRVVGRKLHPGRARGLLGKKSPLVGREQETELLEAALHGLLEGRGQIVTLIGEAGLGKSRLLEDLYARAATKPEMKWIESRGISFDMGRPYGLFVQHLRQVCGLLEDDPPEVVAARVRETFADLDEFQQALISRLVDLLLSAHPGEGDGSPGGGEMLKREIFGASLALWRGQAQQSPLVMVFDDLHWADPASVELLSYLFRLTEDVPVLFLCAFRPHRSAPGWQVKASAQRDYPAHYQELVLVPLSLTQSEELIANLLTIPDIPERLRNALLRKSEGNPFFLEEVVRALMDHEIVGQDGYLQAGGSPEDFEIPDSLQALLLARIDRLESEARRTLQLASVIGRSFYYRVLQTISQQVHELDLQLVSLQQLELIREANRQPELEYSFRHELTRDAAYQSILRRQRRQYHRRVAEAMEVLYPGRLEEEAYRLAYHFEQAGDGERALQYYVTAGDHAARLYANLEAYEHYQAGLKLVRQGISADAPQLIHIYTRLGRSLELLARDQEALAFYQELEALGRTQGKPQLVLAALLAQAKLHSTFTVMMDAGRSQALSLEALGMARELGDPRSEARALWNLVLIENYTSAQVELAVTYGEKALAIAVQHGFREELAFIQHDLARTYYRRGNVEEARRLAMKAQDYWRETGNKPMLADNLTLMAEASYMMAQFEAAAALAEKALHVSQETGNLWGQAYSQYMLAPLYLEWGEVDQGLQLLESSRRLAEQAQFTAPLMFLQMIRGWAYGYLGDRETAVRLLENVPMPDPFPSMFGELGLVVQLFRSHFAGEPDQARAVLDEIGDSILAGAMEQYFGPLIYAFALQVLLASSDFERALAASEVYQQHMGSNHIYLSMPDLLRDRGRALLGLGRRSEAYTSLQEAYREAREQNSRRALPSILADLVELAPDPAQAAAYREEGRQVVKFVADRISEPLLRAAFLNTPAARGLLGQAAYPKTG